MGNNKMVKQMESRPKLTEKEMAAKLKKAYKMQMEKGIEPAFSDDVTEELNYIKDTVNMFLDIIISTTYPRTFIESTFELIWSEIDDFEKLIYENRKPAKSEKIDE